MKKKSLITLIATVAVIAALGVGATLAYFTDSESVTNVVTMGNVNVNLTENEVVKGENGEYTVTTPITEEGLTFDEIVPGQVLPKNPTVTVAEGSQNAYVRVNMQIESDGIGADTLAVLNDALKAQIVADDAWSYNEEDGYYYYGVAMKAGDSVAMFETVTIPATWGNEVADKSFNIMIQAEAVQASNLGADFLTVDEETDTVIGWALEAAPSYEVEVQE